MTAKCAVAAVLLSAAIFFLAPRASAAEPALVEPHFDGDFAVMADGARLPLRVWAAKTPKAVIVGVHGHNNYSGNFAIFGPAPWLAARGITLYAYDQRGFGHAPDRGGWAGAGLMAEDLATVARLAAAAHPGVPLYIMGESMGGDVTILAATRPDAPKVTGLILASPALKGWETANIFMRSAFRLAAYFFPDAIVPRRLLVWRSTDNDALIKANDADPNRLHEMHVGTLPGIAGLVEKARADAPRIRVPTLYLYGAHDEAVPVASIAPIVGKMREAHVPFILACYPDGWHSILMGLNRETVWRDVASWIADPRTALPSGADEHAERCGLEQ